MNFVITKVGILRNLKNNTNFLTLKEYILIAKKIISKYAEYFGKNLKQRMLSSEDAIGYVCYHLMMGDWSYDPSRMCKQTYLRLRSGLWAIRSYKRELWREFHRSNTQQLGSYDGAISKESPSDELFGTPLHRLCEKFLNNSGLTNNEKAYIDLYFLKGMKLQEIVEIKGTSVQNIQQAISRGVNKMKLTNQAEYI